jgi:putative GTP pyrophosphokinase
MSFAPKPTESKKKINKAGSRLVQVESDERAREIVDKWRACHAYPINTFRATLTRKLSRFPESIVAQRLKRMPTIIDKLKRYPAMNLTTMQDIGGVRAIVKNVKDVRMLAKIYKDKSRFKHILIKENDYISNPRSEDGYRSLHLVYKYVNSLAPDYEGLMLELQIRTKTQHIWATAVETMGTFLGQALKSRQGDQEWLDFFALVSNAFAYKERTTLIPRYEHLSAQETHAEIRKLESRLGALDKMRGFSAALNEITKSRSFSYHLITLNSLTKSVEISAFGRDEFETAVNEYTKAEARAASGEKIEPVLVSAGPMNKLRQAYPNFFLDIGEFVKKVEQIVNQTR